MAFYNALSVVRNLCAFVVELDLMTVSLPHRFQRVHALSALHGVAMQLGVELIFHANHVIRQSNHGVIRVRCAVLQPRSVHGHVLAGLLSVAVEEALRMFGVDGANFVELYVKAVRVTITKLGHTEAADGTEVHVDGSPLGETITMSMAGSVGIGAREIPVDIEAEKVVLRHTTLLASPKRGPFRSKGEARS